MEVNKDEAIRCLAISQKHLEAGNYTSARKFCLKSISLFATPEARKLLHRIDHLAPKPSSSTTEGPSTSQADGHPTRRSSSSKANDNGTAGGMGGEKREYTPEQAAVVKRVRSCKLTAYYEILAVAKDCDEADLKKAYRKLALALHPDKNGAPGADEAFKLVSKAFQVLSDPHKRAAFDSGSDPEDRLSGMGSRFSSATFANGAQSAEVSPEELFNMFFGGGGANAFAPSFGGGPTVFTFGPAGFRTSFTRAGTGDRGANTPRSLLLQLAPLLLLFAISFLTNLPNLFSSPPIPDPRFSFSSTSKFNTEMETGHLGVHYFVNPGEFTNHPVIGAEMARECVTVGWVVEEPITKGERQLDDKSRAKTRKVVRGKGKRRGAALKKFEDTIEQVYTRDLYAQCQRGMDSKGRAKEAEIGIFGIGVDWEKVKRIESEVIVSCEELRGLGLLR